MADPRIAAVNNVLAVLDGRSLDHVLATAPVTDERDRALAAELSFGVCRWYRRLDALIALLLQKPFKSRDRDLHALLLVGTYQLLYSRIPPHAAVSSVVEASRGLGKAWASKLVNGVLRRLQREREALEQRVDTDAATRFAQPDWLYQAIVSAWPAQAERILASLQGRPPMVLRVALSQIGRADYLARLAAQGLSAQAHPTVPSALVLDSAVPVDRLPGFEQGLVSVQDAGAQLAAACLDLRQGQRVLDACAAPGGKTLDILQHVGGLQVTALDVDAERLQRVAQNLQRGGLHADLHAGDAAQPQHTNWGASHYDRILVDAPCSATGVMRRHPDIRLLRRASDLPDLVQRQSTILSALWGLLVPGGRLVYVTCSLLPAENAQQVEAFLARHQDARAVELPTVPGTRCGEGVQLLPGIDDTDGFYYAALQKLPAS
ncbi:MAG: 16S rRNA (cytosine(967)-C(5))-methyltransferase RsmB [Sedimenticolaceae bacterium]